MPPLLPFYLINFTCDSCQQEFRQETAYSEAKHLNQLAQFPTYCANCVEETEEITCSFFQRVAGQIITCDKSLFNKKKALCHSHNRQVRQDLTNSQKTCQLPARLPEKWIETSREVDVIFET